MLLLLLLVCGKKRRRRVKIDESFSFLPSPSEVDTVWIIGERDKKIDGILKKRVQEREGEAESFLRGSNML